MKRVVTIVTGLMLLIGMAAFAKVKPVQGNGQTAKTRQSASSTARMHQASGTISSINGNNLVLDHKVRGKEQQTPFVMNDQTKREGDLKVGEKVTVHYRTENKENVVTMVKASPATARAGKR